MHAYTMHHMYQFHATAIGKSTGCKEMYALMLSTIRLYQMLYIPSKMYEMKSGLGMFTMATRELAKFYIIR